MWLISGQPTPENSSHATYPAPLVALTIPTDPQSVEEGRRLATVHGCVHDCHGKEGEGRVMFDDPKIAQLVAPNLTVYPGRIHAAAADGSGTRRKAAGNDE